ncbi:hypothetical protein HYZ64_00595 [Candidatus Berkelbacteria bacterium]|nr:hypothetical protein [Candidatus Berkelbacteria bacterium]
MARQIATTLAHHVNGTFSTMMGKLRTLSSVSSDFSSAMRLREESEDLYRRNLKLHSTFYQLLAEPVLQEQLETRLETLIPFTPKDGLEQIFGFLVEQMAGCPGRVFTEASSKQFSVQPSQFPDEKLGNSDCSDRLIDFCKVRGHWGSFHLSELERHYYEIGYKCAEKLEGLTEHVQIAGGWEGRGVIMQEPDLTCWISEKFVTDVYGQRIMNGSTV